MDFDETASQADGDAMPVGPSELKTGFNTQVSSNSDASTTHSLEELSAPEFFEHQCSEIDAMTSRVVRESSIREAICAAVADGQVCITVGDPRSPDAALIAVSEQFETMTGYRRSEILGKNCRFLNTGCSMDAADLLRLRLAADSGAPFTGILENRRKSGEFFLNLLDLRGLTVARNPFNGDELWFLIGIQADVTTLQGAAREVQEAKLAELHGIASSIRAKLADELSALAVSGALMSNFEVTEEGNYLQSRVPFAHDPEVWSLLSSPMWICSETPPPWHLMTWGPLTRGLSGVWPSQTSLGRLYARQSPSKPEVPRPATTDSELNRIPSAVVAASALVVTSLGMLAAAAALRTGRPIPHFR
eukprot:TRINITY_DN93204_c0_g1_i1.p1 TRINITY_DN93204_c0_g1~~TRINITY_DN93204_c0_g1_i1.p1  ORF type:complete len:362 (+),score=64.84 TRINITY_DN93204_c0_g1_i1:112-1197(+)